MIKELSILIPTYNTCCTELVKALVRQAGTIEDLQWEIVVADDASTEKDFVRQNMPIGQMNNCSYITLDKNIGRAAIRNFLGRKARYDWLLLMDDDMEVGSNSFLYDYLNAEGDVIYGGYRHKKECPELRHNLRYQYEHAKADIQSCQNRQKSPYRHFHTANFLIRKELFLRYPFDERFRQYGYEDVFYGKTLKEHHIPITHVDNGLIYNGYEENAVFVGKTEEALRTLSMFAAELKDYSTMLTLSERLHRYRLSAVVRRWHRIFGRAERKNLCGRHPSLFLLKLYKVGYFMSIHTTDSASFA